MCTWPLVGMALKATTCLTGFCSLSNGAFKVDWLRCLTSSAGKGHLGTRPFPSFQNPHLRIWMSFRDKVRNLVPGLLFFRPLYKEKGEDRHWERGCDRVIPRAHSTLKKGPYDTLRSLSNHNGHERARKWKKTTHQVNLSFWWHFVAVTKRWRVNPVVPGFHLFIWKSLCHHYVNFNATI